MHRSSALRTLAYSTCMWNLLSRPGEAAVKLYPSPQLLSPHPPIPSFLAVWFPDFLHLAVGVPRPLGTGYKKKRKYDPLPLVPFRVDCVVLSLATPSTQVRPYQPRNRCLGGWPVNWTLPLIFSFSICVFSFLFRLHRHGVYTAHPSLYPDPGKDTMEVRRCQCQRRSAEKCQMD